MHNSPMTKVMHGPMTKVMHNLRNQSGIRQTR